MILQKMKNGKSAGLDGNAVKCLKKWRTPPLNGHAEMAQRFLMCLYIRKVPEVEIILHRVGLKMERG